MRDTRRVLGGTARDTHRVLGGTVRDTSPRDWGPRALGPPGVWWAAPPSYGFSSNNVGSSRGSRGRREDFAT